MKNNKLTYVLVPLVIFIWGLLIYRAIDGFSGSDDEVYAFQPAKVLEDDTDTLETFELLGNYRDPFLGKTYYKPSGSNVAMPKKNSIAKPTTKKPITPLVVRNLNFVKYHGSVTNKGKKKVAIMTINKEPELLNEGDVYEEIKLAQIFEDSIKIYYQNEYVFVKKEKEK